MPSFDWNDPFLLEDQLTDEERLIRDTARGYARTSLAPRIVEAFQNRTDRYRHLPRARRAGSASGQPSQEYGGAGANYVAYGLIAREIERVDSGYRSMMSVQSSLVMLSDQRVRIGSPEAEPFAQAGQRASSSAPSA